jgi:hypothetical protein
MAQLTAIDGDQLGMLKAQGIEEGRVHQFRQRLQLCGLLSLDAFLARNPDFSRIGKIRIAQSLAAAEKASADGRGGAAWGRESWYQYLFAQLMDSGSRHRFLQNQVSFVTVNYDRSLEFELTRMLYNAYGGTWDDCAQIVSRLEIVHLHGSLGPLPGFAANGVPYGEIAGADAITQAASTLLILGETGSEKEYERAGS